jgi:hypothetical protein
MCPLIDSVRGLASCDRTLSSIYQLNGIVSCAGFSATERSGGEGCLETPQQRYQTLLSRLGGRCLFLDDAEVGLDLFSVLVGKLDRSEETPKLGHELSQHIARDAVACDDTACAGPLQDRARYVHRSDVEHLARRNRQVRSPLVGLSQPLLRLVAAEASKTDLVG